MAASTGLRPISANVSRISYGLQTIRPQSPPFSRSAIAWLCGLDVLVEPEHIAWVVLFLDLHEASIIRTVGRADKLVTRIAQLVHIHSLRERLQTVARSLDPSHPFGLLCGSTPQTRYVYLITRLTKSKRRITQTYTANSPAQRHYDRLAFCRRMVDCRGNRCNSRLTEFAKKKVRLEVRDRSQEKSARRLGAEIRHDLDAVILRFECTQRADQVIPRSRIAAKAEIDFESWLRFGRQQLGYRVHFIRSRGEKVDEGVQKFWNASGWIH